jgi:hypothetical protein
MNIPNFLTVPDKNTINKVCTKNKAVVFFSLSITANLSSGGMEFLILVS